MHPTPPRRLAALALATTALAASGAGSASAAGVTVTEGDSGNAFATLDVSASQPTTIDWKTVDGTATGDVDYMAFSFGQLPFLGAGGTKQVFIPVQGDTLHEDDETFDVQFAGTGLTSPVTQTVTIVDDDPAPQIKVSDVTVNEHDGTARFDVALSEASGLPVDADWSTADGTATAPGDYAAKSGHLTFAPGETTKSVTVDLANDAAHEDTERFALRLSNLQGANAVKI